MIRERARVVIVGGGIAGASIAYHLGQLGWRDVVVLEQGDLVSGTTSHAPGLVGQLRSSVSLTRMLMYSVSLYRTLEVDGERGYFEVGGLRLASSKGRLAEIKRQAAFAASVGLEAHLVSASEAANLFPLMSLEAVEGALYLPQDGSATAPLLARAMINKATEMGISFYPRTQVRAIKTVNGQVQAIETTAGQIETETLIVAVGIWSPLVAKLAGVLLPIVPMQHQYVVTEPLTQLSGQALPNLRDPDKLVYMRQNGDSLVLGGYERNPRPVRAEDIPDRPDPTVQNFDPAHFEPLRRAAAERVPVLGTTGLHRQVNGLESFTPDGEYLLGPSGQVRGLWAACGFCAHGVSGAGGVGKVMAEWVVEGKPPMDVSEMAPERFGAKAADSFYIEQKACKMYSTYYDLQPSPV